MARRYEFYVLVARTISHSFASLTREILFLPLEHKIHIFSPPCNILYIYSSCSRVFCNIKLWPSNGTTRSHAISRKVVINPTLLLRSLSNKTITAEIDRTTSVYRSECNKWRFICRNRNITKSTVSSSALFCNLLPRSSKESRSRPSNSTVSAIFEEKVCLQGFVGLEWTW